jgi:hypothetical protein
MPYFVMIDRLRAFLRNGQRPVALFVVGYSFGDQHLNEVIVDSLRANSSAACFALQYNALSAYPNAQKLAETNVNLSVLARDAAVIRRKKAVWMLQPAADLAAIRFAFELAKPEEGEAKGTEEADEPRPCRLTIGDFQSLGQFLDEFSGYGTFDTMGLE